MIERRFHRDLYTEAAVRGAVDVFARHATITTADEGEHRVVRVETKRPERALRVADELCNYALGLMQREDAR